MFSIIMPVYNCVSTVDRAIESVCAQTWKDFELIIVDDGSTDGSYEKCVYYEKMDSRIHVYKNQHGGVSSARNRGIDESNGEIILFIDSDDFWESTLLENAGDIKNNTYKLFGSRTIYFDAEGNKCSASNEFSENETKRYLLNDISVDELMRYNIAAPWNKFFERRIITENNIRFHTECVYLEDLAFNLEYLKYCTTVEVIPLNLHNYRINITEKQILKRNFKHPFLNADILFSTAEQFLVTIGKAFGDSPVLTSTVYGAYCREALSWIYNKNRETVRKYLKLLNHNKNFKEVLDKLDGKFIKLFRFAVKHNLLMVEEKMLKRRFW